MKKETAAGIICTVIITVLLAGCAPEQATDEICITGISKADAENTIGKDMCRYLTKESPDGGFFEYHTNRKYIEFSMEYNGNIIDDYFLHTKYQGVLYVSVGEKYLHIDCISGDSSYNGYGYVFPKKVKGETGLSDLSTQWRTFARFRTKNNEKYRLKFRTVSGRQTDRPKSSR